MVEMVDVKVIISMMVLCKLVTVEIMIEEGQGFLMH